jgi:pimeloyl-ACP methyl ester carboxylesterase
MKQIFLLHGKGGSPQGSVSKLEPLLREAHPEFLYHRLLLPHHDPAVLAEESVEYLREMQLPKQSRLIGISLGGLVAAKLQEDSRPDLSVACVSSPTWADGVRLETKPPHRIAIYSSNDNVIADRVSDWPQLAEAYDLAWLTHDTDLHKERISALLNRWIASEPLAEAAQSV